MREGFLKPRIPYNTSLVVQQPVLLGFLIWSYDFKFYPNAVYLM